MANSYELVGKVALLKRIPDKVTFGGFIAAVRTRGIDPKFLFFSLREPETKERIRRSSSRTVNIANISLKTLYATRFVQVGSMAGQYRQHFFKDIAPHRDSCAAYRRATANRGKD